MDLTTFCDWPTSPCPTCNSETEGLGCLNKSQRDEVVAWAQSDLWRATHQVFGTCPVSVLPCQNLATLCGSCSDSYRRCGCVSVSEVKLPGPVASVTEVVIDGVTLDSTAYRVDDYQWLLRLDGGTWPTSNNIVDPDDFRVDYVQGIAPPAGAGIVTGILACERAKAICGDKTCRLPRRAREVSRQGVTMIWSEEGFGLPEVDEWVRNANAPLFAGAVHSPDLPHVRRITWQSDGSP